jgi:4-hydroxybenzoyl-CoA thioesterase/acyl-CoA thioester hydrolase
MAETYRMQRRVEFCETDAAGIAHFSAFFQYMEQAEHALLRHLGLSVLQRDEQGAISWPRVSAHCDFEAAVRFEQLVDIEVSVERIGERSVTYGFGMRHDARQIARGRMTSVCCRIADDHLPQPIPIPSWIAERLRPYVAGPVE